MSRRERILALGGTAAAALAVAAFGSGAHTYAGFSDFQIRHVHVGAGVWAPDPPAECGALSKYTKVVYGTPGNDVFPAENHPQIIMGLGGDDVSTAATRTTAWWVATATITSTATTARTS